MAIESITPFSDQSLVVTDNTVNNVSTSAHGFVVKAPNSTSQFFRGDASWAAVTDANLSVSDVTTNDATSSAHGFFPKLAMSAWQSFTSNPVGFTGSPTITAVYLNIGKTTFIFVDISGTSNATNFTFSLPTTPANTSFQAARVINNGAVQTTAMVEITSTGALVFTTWAGGAFTNSGTKQLNGFQAMYQNT